METQFKVLGFFFSVLTPLDPFFNNWGVINTKESKGLQLNHLQYFLPYIQRFTVIPHAQTISNVCQLAAHF